MNYKDPAALLLGIRTSEKTDPAVLKSDWLPMTLKAATGGVETFTIKFYSIRGEEIAASLDCAVQDATEYSLAEALTNDASTAAVGLDCVSWATSYASIVPKIAYIAVSSVVGTIYVGRGATSDKGYGTFDGATFSITGPAAGTTPVLANTNYGIGA